jgi:hypothetical protein
MFKDLYSQSTVLELVLRYMSVLISVTSFPHVHCSLTKAVDVIVPLEAAHISRSLV